jgi:hypothetical protein
MNKIPEYFKNKKFTISFMQMFKCVNNVVWFCKDEVFADKKSMPLEAVQTLLSKTTSYLNKCKSSRQTTEGVVLIINQYLLFVFRILV